MRDGFAIKFLDDGTVDMGSSFDLFDVASHYQNELIPAENMAMRIYLKNIMQKHGFSNYAEEWWHFTLKNGPILHHLTTATLILQSNKLGRKPGFYGDYYEKYSVTFFCNFYCDFAFRHGGKLSPTEIFHFMDLIS